MSPLCYPSLHQFLPSKKKIIIFSTSPHYFYFTTLIFHNFFFTFLSRSAFISPHFLQFLSSHFSSFTFPQIIYFLSHNFSYLRSHYFPTFPIPHFSALLESRLLLYPATLPTSQLPSFPNLHCYYSIIPLQTFFFAPPSLLHLPIFIYFSNFPNPHFSQIPLFPTPYFLSLHKNKGID